MNKLDEALTSEGKEIALTISKAISGDLGPDELLSLAESLRLYADDIQTEADNYDYDKSLTTDAKQGDYVLATKYSDGSPQDDWAVGFFDGTLDQYSTPRFEVVDEDGRLFRGNGFGRCEKISGDQGKVILETLQDDRISLLGLRSIWDLLK